MKQTRDDLIGFCGTGAATFRNWTRSLSHQRLNAVVALFLVALFGTGAFAQVAKKGVGAWPGYTNEINNMNSMGLGWYYDWGSSSIGSTPGIQYVPMIWGQSDVNSTELNAAVASGSGVLLGFNEPNVGGQSNMSVAQAIAD